MEMVNGYVFLDLTKSNVYSKALKVLGTDKPVVIKDGSGSPYFVDSLTLDGTNIIITKGGKTITIANDNTITNVGDIQNHLYKYAIELINDANGNATIFVDSDTIITTENAFSKIYVGANGINDELGNSGKYICVISRTNTTIALAIDEGNDFEISTNDAGFDISITLIKQLF